MGILAPACRKAALFVVPVALVAWSGAAHADPAEVALIRSDPGAITIEYRVNEFFLEPVEVNGRIMSRIVLDDEAPLAVAGAPEVPSVTRSVAIWPTERVRARIVAAEHEDIAGVELAPSKGLLYRSQNPADVPHSFGEAYESDELYPAALARLGEPYLMRDARGAVIDLYPFRYNPVSGVLRVYRRVVLELVPDGPDSVNTIDAPARHRSAAFEQILRRRFLNWDRPPLPDPYPAVTETGDMLIICHDAWLSNVAPLVNHKNSIGIPTTAVGVSTIGNTSSAIAAHIQDVYDTSNLAFVLLVGDSAQVASPTSSGGSSDPSYAKVAGGDDYPDLLIGRFSAESAAQVDTQVSRTIAYETTPATTQPWFKRAVGIGSSEGPGDDGEYDWQHIDKIRTDLLGYDYTEVDQIYDPGASASAVTTALNEGRGLVNYTGHGSSTSWGTTGFSVSNVNALTNDGMLPFIFSVACVVGDFAGQTCFAEAWLRATNGGAPTGAIGIYASSINQSWDPPMAAQDECNDLLVAEAHFSFGALCFAGASLMIDEYGSGGVEMYDTWHVFGDPSVRVFGAATPASGLAVDPLAGQQIEGDAGGPFAPDAVVYTLSNNGESAIGWEVSIDVDWLVADVTSGTLAAGQETDVTISTNDAAEALPNGDYAATVAFENTTDGEGDTTRAVTLVVGVPQAHHEWPLDEDPGWTTQGGWAFGEPTGGGGEHGPSDPTGGHTGDNVYGYNLAGDYPANLGEEHLTTTAIDCSDLSDVSLRFWRWLGVEDDQWDHASISVSTDGETWQDVWRNEGEVSDSGWTQVEYDLSEVADGEETVHLRWTMGATDQGYQYCGWNIDDIEIWGVAEVDCSDADEDGFLPLYCDGEDCDDEDPDVNPDAAEICDDEIDNDCDELVDGEDPDCQGGPGDTDDTDTNGPSTEVFSPGDSGCGCRQTGAVNGSPSIPALLARALF